MTHYSILLLLIAGAFAAFNWRYGLFACIAVGVLQDPLRKVAPGQPQYYVAFAILIFGIAFVRAHLSHVALGPGIIWNWKRGLRLPFTLFLALVLVQAFRSLVAYQNYMLVAVGLLVWLAPPAAVLLAHQFAMRRGLLGIRQLFIWYVGFSLAALTGVYLQYIGYDWPWLGEVGEGLAIYDLGTVLYGNSGFFRSSEIAAWHTAATASFIFMLFVGKRATPSRTILAIALIAVLATLGILTARRKMLVEVTLFVGAYFFLVAWLQRGASRLAIGVLATALASYVVVVAFVSPDLVQRSNTKELQLENPTGFQGYAARGASVFRDVPARFNELGVQPILWAIDNNGWLGSGLGTGSQGTRDVLEKNNVNFGAAEGGLGKIVTELGVPGLFVVALLLVAVAKHVLTVLRWLTRESPKHARVAYALAAFLVANAGVFLVATQVFNDPFILLLLGWSAGFLIALPQVVERERVAAAARAERRARASSWPALRPTMHVAAHRLTK